METRRKPKLKSQRFSAIPVLTVTGWICFQCFLFSGLHGQAAELPWVDFVSFASGIERYIGTDEDADRRSPADVRGLEITEKSVEKFAVWGRSFTNIELLRIESDGNDPLPELISAATNFPRLRYLHLITRKACEVPSMDPLTNLVNLGYLGLDVPMTTNIDSSIYDLSGLRELRLGLRTVDMPRGISRLRHLVRVEIMGSRRVKAGTLPEDFTVSTIEYLEIMNIAGVERVLPELPPEVADLEVMGCGLKSFPSTWLRNRKLQKIEISSNRFTRFPSELPALPLLSELGLNMNDITNVPPIELGKGRRLEVWLLGNPVQHVARENDAQFKRVNIHVH